MKIAGIVLLWSISLVSAKFQLRSETWTNLAGANGAAILTFYHYDNNGNRILKETRPAPDTSGTVMGATKYTYDGAGRTIKIVLCDAADTLSIVQYGYGFSDNLAAIFTQDKTGKVRYVDSLVYNIQGQLIQNRRIIGGVVIQTHNFKYDTGSRLVSDTLYEDTGSGLQPAQAVLTAYDTVGRVASEGNYRYTGGSWYSINTMMMGYTGNQLVSLTNYARNGSDKALLDSVAITYDAYGNRSKELGFDDERLPLYSIVYDWLNLNPGAIRFANVPGHFAFETSSRGLRLVDAETGKILLNMRDARGFLLHQESFVAINGVLEIPWPASLPRGMYVVEVISSQAHQGLTVIRP